jgi:uncharacterized HAD superfamily protein
MLKELGFKTFHPYINESYDNEKDIYKRINMIHNEVEKLCNMSKEELHKWYWNMEDILLYNQDLALNLHKEKNLTLSFIEYLNLRVKI